MEACSLRVVAFIDCTRKRLRYHTRCPSSNTR